MMRLFRYIIAYRDLYNTYNSPHKAWLLLRNVFIGRNTQIICLQNERVADGPRLRQISMEIYFNVLSEWYIAP